jgi:hypothetical protein
MWILQKSPLELHYHADLNKFLCPQLQIAINERTTMQNKETNPLEKFKVIQPIVLKQMKHKGS